MYRARCYLNDYIDVERDEPTKSTALERLVMKLLGGLNRFYGIPTLALGLGGVHTHRFRNTV